MDRRDLLINRTINHQHQPLSMHEKISPLLTRFYYTVKPYVPRSLRWALRRKIAQKIRKNNTATWPVNSAALTPPLNWKGWPNGKKFAILLTHDVESEQGLSKVRTLAQIEQAFGLKASFNFIPQGNYEFDKDLRSWLEQMGFEVGVHDLYHNGKLYHTRNGFKKQAVEINRYLKEWGAVGFRSGFMLRNHDWLHDLNVEYDASTFDTDPFEPQPDGCKTIFPFFVSSPKKTIDGGYVELPYTLPQDSTLFLLLREQGPEIWLRKLDTIAKCGGLALVNIHPDYIDFESSKPSNHHYPASHVECLFKYLMKNYQGQFWNPLPKDLAEWYRGSVGKAIPANQQRPTNPGVASKI